MKRMMIATALATTLGTAAVAATDTQIRAIEGFGAGIDVTAMSDAELDIAYGIVHSGASTSEKMAKLKALELEDGPGSLATLSTIEMMRLQQYAPDVDLSTITQAEAESALAITYGGESEAVKRQRVEALLTDLSVADTTATEIASVQLNLIQSYVPDVTVTDLTEQDVQLIMSFIHSDMSRGEMIGKIESIVNG